MSFIADLHLHSHFSRATSKNLNLESLYQWAGIKGINIIGTGDFTHPGWINELQEKLIPDGNGFFILKNKPDPLPGFKTKEIDIRFCLSTEISSIYKWNGKVRKNHNIVFAPDLETAGKINAKLSLIGNLSSDGRPILGLSSRDLLEIILQTSPDAHLVPAHIWTPWFSMLGSKSGYDSVKECFRDLTDNIFALETGLSSDPEMNWLLSTLDNYSLISNSDAHSPPKLGREANVFDVPLSYYEMFNALKTKKGFSSTYEFFPEEGKYHLDGHRNCKIRYEPEETATHKGICPKCGSPLTIGVLNRVMALADRKQAVKPNGAGNFRYIIPLPEILSEIGLSPVNSKQTFSNYRRVISAAGNEFTLLAEIPVEDIERNISPVLGEAVRRMRKRMVNPSAGYDGEFGVIRIFKEGELQQFTGQSDLFGFNKNVKTHIRKSKKAGLTKTKDHKISDENNVIPEKTKAALNKKQLEVLALEGPVLVVAGPGTGKTRTLISWIADRIKNRGIRPEEIMAVTFTNKAADEIRDRLTSEIGKDARNITAGTFHSVCLGLLKKAGREISVIYDEENRRLALSLIYPRVSLAGLKALSATMGKYFETGHISKSNIEDVDTTDAMVAYRRFLGNHKAIDLSTMISSVNELFDSGPLLKTELLAAYQCLAVDELQDINPVQYGFLHHFSGLNHLLAIGDPDQAVYSFRGSDVNLFFRFRDEFNAKVISLAENYRSSPGIITSSSEIIKHNPDHGRVSQIAVNNTSTAIFLKTCRDPDEEGDFIADEIEKCVGGFYNLSVGAQESRSMITYSFRDIAVLFRLRSVGEEILLKLERKGIPARLSDNNNFFEEPPFDRIRDIFRILRNPCDYISFFNICVWCLQKKPHEAMKLIGYLQEENKSCDDSALLSAKDPLLQKWLDFYNRIKHLSTAGNIHQIVTAIFEQYIRDADFSPLEKLKKETILDLASQSATMDQFLRTMTLDPFTDAGRIRTDVVRLLTFHSSKGMEFPVVFIAGAEDGITPYTKRDAPPDEERRLFYVALTRAAERVYISHCRKRHINGEQTPVSPSRFIHDIPKQYITEFTCIGKDNAHQLALF